MNTNDSTKDSTKDSTNDGKKDTTKDITKDTTKDGTKDTKNEDNTQAITVLNEIYNTDNLETKIELIKANYHIYTLSDTFPEHTNTKFNNFFADFLCLTKNMKNKEYSKAKEIITKYKQNFYSMERIYDFVFSKIFLFSYLIHKKDASFLSQNFFFEMYTIHKENKNKECVLICTNIILDLLVSKNYYKECLNIINTTVLDADSINYYYKGRVYLVSSDYHSTYESFQKAMILSTDNVFINFVEKYSIVSLLMKSELFILKNYAWKRDNYIFFELYESIKSGNIKEYDNTMERNKEMYKKYNLYTILRRLYQNVIFEGIRKIAKCYCRISINDIAQLLNMEDIEYLINKGIKENRIKGVVQNGIYIVEEKESMSIEFGDRVKDVIGSFECMKKLMRYPKVKPLKFENVDKNSIVYDFTS
ncbi:26S proteasome non-ATPase regulatory subunit 3 [Binucleata daphniae]